VPCPQLPWQGSLVSPCPLLHEMCPCGAHPTAAASSTRTSRCGSRPTLTWTTFPTVSRGCALDVVACVRGRFIV
jgi:hypothetical protein